MRRLGVALAVWTLVASAKAPSSASEPDFKVVDGMAAKINGQVVTVREARFFLALQRFREGKGQGVFAPEAQGELRSAVQRLLLEEMVYSELKSLKFEGGTRPEAVRSLATPRKGAGEKVWARMLKTYGKSESEVIDRVWKSQQVEKFIQRRVETMTPIVTAAEIDRYLKQKASSQDKRIEDKSLEKLRPGAAQELKKELMRKELEEWIVLLKRKYSVTNYLES